MNIITSSFSFQIAFVLSYKELNNIMLLIFHLMAGLHWYMEGYSSVKSCISRAILDALAQPLWFPAALQKCVYTCPFCVILRPLQLTR